MGTANSRVARVAALHVDGRVQRGERPTIDIAAAERAVGDLLEALGRDLTDHGLRETPRRVAGAYAELLTHEPVALTTFS
ncbi:MAG: GTP cyclohydrolase I, partial [Actinobacteria bacterium]|nr:GTP cyclohydrolase I [Actinomycetota bacterium]